MTTEKVKIGPLAIRPHVRGGLQTGSWQLDLPPYLTTGGRRERHLFASQDEAIAEAKHMLREAQVREKVNGGRRTIGTGVLLHEVAQGWSEEQRDRVLTKKKRLSSLLSDLHRLKAIIDFLGPDDIAAIDEKRIVAFQKHRLKAGCVPVTVNHEVQQLLTLLHWAKKPPRKLLAEVPQPELMPVFRRQYDLPTPQELAAILTHLTGWRRVLIWLMAATGARPSEAYNLTWADIDLTAGMVRFRARDDYAPKTQESQRDLPISDALRDALTS
jgi:integrase